MKLHDADSESSFLATFDTNFPYSDGSAASKLIEQGWATSLNGSFCVLNEICRPPLSADVNVQRLLDLASEWDAAGQHEIKQDVLRCATALIQNRPMAVSEVASVMEKVGSIDAQRAALAIVYFSAFLLTDGDQLLEDLSESISKSWDDRNI